MGASCRYPVRVALQVPHVQMDLGSSTQLTLAVSLPARTKTADPADSGPPRAQPVPLPRR